MHYAECQLLGLNKLFPVQQNRVLEVERPNTPCQFGLPILMDKQCYDWPDLHYLDHVAKCLKSSIKVNI